MKKFCTTIGNFDGLHIGHKAMITEIINKSKLLDLSSQVITFNPYPFEHFKFDKKRILADSDKLEMLNDLGVDRVISIDFNQDFSELTAESFFTKYILDEGTKYLTVGKDFKFGKDRSGNVTILKNLCEQNEIKFEVFEDVDQGGERVSSTRIREQLSKGNFEQAERMLGYKYRITGQIISGKKIGRRIDTPTANIEIDNQEFCLNGVYLCKTKLNDQMFFSIVNFGPKPTFDDYKQSLEAHLLDFEGNLYNQSVCVEFLCKIRDQVKFASIDELKAQINKDKKTAFELIKSYE